MSKLTVHLVTWNGAKYLPYLFKSLRAQTFTDWELIVIDNASSDTTVAVLEQELANFPRPYRFIKNEQNVGFAPAHNKAIRGTEAPYFLLLNQDMFLSAECLEKMVIFLDTHPEAAAVSPRLMRWDFALAETDFEKSLTNRIDALGLKIFRNRRIIEQYTQMSWDEVPGVAHQDILPVFGVSGAFPMFRRAAIEQVAFENDNMFDESYHSYKEDADLALRLCSQNFKSFVLTSVVAHHDRSGAGPRELDDAAAAKNKRAQSAWVKYHSYKNHLRTLYKNEYWQNVLLDFPWIFWYELKKFVYFLLFDRAVLRGLCEIWKNRRDLSAKRREITARRRISWRAMRHFWL